MEKPSLREALKELALTAETGFRNADLRMGMGVCAKLHTLSDQYGQEIVERTISSLSSNAGMSLRKMFVILKSSGKLDKPDTAQP